MLRVTEVVKHLLILNVIIFACRYFVPLYYYEYLVLYPPGSGMFKPFQLVSHMFMHADGSHILFNMLGLFFLGPTVESYLGPKRFLILYFLSGFGALAIHMLMALAGVITLAPLLGASGAVFGVYVAFATLFPNTKLMLIFPPIPIKAKYLIMILVAYDLYHGYSNAVNLGNQSNIAHFAHLGGALTGFLVITYWKKQGFRRR